MKHFVRIACMFCMFLTLLLGFSLAYAQSLAVPVNKYTVASFSFSPPQNYTHPAMLFRVVDQDDTRLNTAPMLDQGRTVFISLEEMKRLIERLTVMQLAWHRSAQTELPSIGHSEVSNEMRIRVYDSTGSFLALLSPRDLCASLASLNDAIKQPRALWEFRLFQREYGCKIPGFNRDAYPNHDAGQN